MTALRDSQLRIERAAEQLGELRRLSDEWTKAQPVQIVQHHDSQTGWHRLRVQQLLDPPDHWVVLLGEFAYNLRSALNYLVEGLVIANKATVKKAHQYPIYSDPTEGPAGVPKSLVGIAKGAFDLIENRQPYKRPHRTEPDLLEVLAGLSNVDKHRHLHASAVVMGAWWQPSVETKADRPITIVEFAPPYDPGAAVLETDLFGMRVVPPEAVVDVKVENPIPVEIVFRNGSMYRLNGLPLLVTEVRAIRDELSPFM